MVTDAQLARMRAQVVQRLPQTAELQRIETISDGAGGWSEQPVTVGTVPCRLDPVSKTIQARVFGQQESTLVHYQLTCPWDAPLEANDQVVIAGKTYQVIQVEIDHGWRVSRRAIVSEVR